MTGAPVPDPSSRNAAALPHDADDLPAVTTQVDRRQIRQFATTLRSAEQQIGDHIMTALQDPGTVAVLTAVVVAPDGSQQIVSAALDAEMMQQVQQLLRDAEQQREGETPCVGFHCLIKRKHEAP